LGGSLRHHPDDQMRDNSIVLYARDYREMGQWIPLDATLFIGRYMFEADTVPRTWARHMNMLDEVWVPSQWQKEAFENGGVHPESMQVGAGRFRIRSYICGRFIELIF